MLVWCCIIRQRAVVKVREITLVRCSTKQQCLVMSTSFCKHNYILENVLYTTTNKCNDEGSIRRSERAKTWQRDERTKSSKIDTTEDHESAGGHNRSDNNDHQAQKHPPPQQRYYPSRAETTRATTIATTTSAPTITTSAPTTTHVRVGGSVVHAAHQFTFGVFIGLRGQRETGDSRGCIQCCVPGRGDSKRLFWNGSSESVLIGFPVHDRCVCDVRVNP